MLLDLVHERHTEVPEFDVYSMTFRADRVNIVYEEDLYEEEIEDQIYDIEYEQIEDQEASRSSRLVAQPRKK
jgi:hypothetical protein